MSAGSARKALFLLIALFLIFSDVSAGDGLTDQKKLDRAIWLYNHENYDEALLPLQELLNENPRSSAVAYYLGMTLKQLQRYKAAAFYLESAATLKPRVDNAVIELIDILFKLERIEETKKWVEIADKDGIAPAQIAFMKGLIFFKENKDIDSIIAEFNKAQKLDESLAGTVKYYEGLAYLQAKNLSKAKDVFRTVVISAPGQGLAAYANEYMDNITRVEDINKPFHGYVQAMLQYDTNVLLMPNDENAVSGISDQGDWRQAYTIQGDYNIKLGDTLAIKPGYTFYCAKQFNLGFYDMLSYDATLIPGAYFEKLAVTFPTHYNYMTVNDKGYLSVIGVSNLDNYMITKVDMAQFIFQYNRKIFLWQPNPAEENRTSNEYMTSVGWYRFFAKGRGFFNLTYALNLDDTKGNNWKYLGNRLTAASTIPVFKSVKWNIALDYFHETFLKKNSVYEKDRYDNVLTISNLIAIELFKNGELQLQHSFVDDAASLGIYKYRRNVFGAGMKYQF
ncbi:MAG: hypothetical protein V1682_01605 [Candidatus Omnitrophota bacterium]